MSDEFVQPDYTTFTVQDIVEYILSGEFFDEEAREGIDDLIRRSDQEVFTCAIDLTQSLIPLERRLGVEILARIGLDDPRKRRFFDDALLRLLKLLDEEEHPEVLAAIVKACRHHHDIRIIDPLTQLLFYPATEVRLALAQSLSGFDDEHAIMTLNILAEDEDAEVRGRAVSGLARATSVNTTELRDALHERLDDEDEDVRGEAMVGLARCADDRLIARIVSEAEKYATDINSCEAVVKAGITTGDNRLYPILLSIQSRWEELASSRVDLEILTELFGCPLKDFDIAIERCRPKRKRQALVKG